MNLHGSLDGVLVAAVYTIYPLVPVLCVAFGLSVASGCAVSVPEGRFACDTRAECPAGWACLHGRCERRSALDGGADAAHADSDASSPGPDSADDGSSREDGSTGCRMEVCDGDDNDCDGEVDEDGDGDGVDVCADCDDADPSRSPERVELCSDGIDNDCDPDTVDACCPPGWSFVAGLCRSPRQSPVSTCREAIARCVELGACPGRPTTAELEGGVFSMRGRDCRILHPTMGETVFVDDARGSFPFYCVSRPLGALASPCEGHLDCPRLHECAGGSCQLVATPTPDCCAADECACGEVVLSELEWREDGLFAESAVPGVCG